MDKKILPKKIIVTGGGSGGHISAALSITSTLKEKYGLDPYQFLYIGGDLRMEGEKPGNSLEQELMKDMDFERKYIRAGKLQRSISFNTIKLLFRSLLGMIDSYRIIKSFRPDIVISTGGYVTVSVCLIAKLFKSKIYLHEQTATVGLTNKIVGKIADKIFISFPSSFKYFKKEKTLLTGNLVRPEIFETKGQGQLVESVKKMVSNRDRYPIIYISGGGLGSHLINETVKDSLKLLLQKYQIILQTGDNKVFNDHKSLLNTKENLTEEMKQRFLPVTYIQAKDMGYLLHNIDLYIGRAGANTVYEMGVLQIPSIFIPIPWVTHNEQYKNAEVLANLGLAEIIQEGELTSNCLLLRIQKFLEREKSIDRKQIENVFRIDANKTILKQLDLT